MRAPTATLPLCLLLGLALWAGPAQASFNHGPYIDLEDLLAVFWWMVVAGTHWLWLPLLLGLPIQLLFCGPNPRVEGRLARWGPMALCTVVGIPSLAFIEWILLALLAQDMPFLWGLASPLQAAEALPQSMLWPWIIASLLLFVLTQASLGMALRLRRPPPTAA